MTEKEKAAPVVQELSHPRPHLVLINTLRPVQQGEVRQVCILKLGT